MEIDVPSPTALIIGASRGLGLAMAEEYLRRGWHVTGTVRRTARTALHSVADRAKGRLAVEKVDIVKPTQIAALHRRQIAWMSEARIDGAPVVRACITNFRTTDADIHRIVEEMNQLL